MPCIRCSRPVPYQSWMTQIWWKCVKQIRMGERGYLKTQNVHDTNLSFFAGNYTNRILCDTGAPEIKWDVRLPFCTNYASEVWTGPLLNSVKAIKVITLMLMLLSMKNHRKSIKLKKRLSRSARRLRCRRLTRASFEIPKLSPFLGIINLKCDEFLINITGVDQSTFSIF